MAIFVSRYSHCLYDLLSRWQSGEWTVDIPLDRQQPRATSSTSRAVSASLRARARDCRIADGGRGAAAGAAARGARRLVVLARYMQILSPDFIAAMHEP